MAAIKADPVRLAEWKAKSCRQWRSPEALAARAVAIGKNKAGKRRCGAAGRRHLRKINADPVVMTRRAEAVTASVPQRKQTIAARLAARVGIPVDLVDEFRWLRLHKRRTFSEAEAVAYLEEIHPEAFAAIKAARRLALVASLRDLGPAPAIGMPSRAAWTQRANAISARAV